MDVSGIVEELFLQVHLHLLNLFHVEYVEMMSLPEDEPGGKNLRKTYFFNLVSYHND
ncbi:hypothetical protein Bca4012_038931 [Brassica carinata]